MLQRLHAWFFNAPSSQVNPQPEYPSEGDPSCPHAVTLARWVRSKHSAYQTGKLSRARAEQLMLLPHWLWKTDANKIEEDHVWSFMLQRVQDWPKHPLSPGGWSWPERGFYGNTYENTLHYWCAQNLLQFKLAAQVPVAHSYVAPVSMPLYRIALFWHLFLYQSPSPDLNWINRIPKSSVRDIVLHVTEQVLRGLCASDTSGKIPPCIRLGCCAFDGLYSDFRTLLAAWEAPDRSSLPCFMGREVKVCPTWHNPRDLVKTFHGRCLADSGRVPFNTAVMACNRLRLMPRTIVSNMEFHHNANACTRLCKGCPYPYDVEVFDANAAALGLRLRPCMLTDISAVATFDPFNALTGLHGIHRIGAFLLRIPGQSRSLDPRRSLGIQNDAMDYSRWVALLPAWMSDQHAMAEPASAILCDASYPTPFFLSAAETFMVLQSCAFASYERSSVNDVLWGCFAMSFDLLSTDMHTHC